MTTITRTPALGYAVAHFGRLTLTSHDYARYEPPRIWEDSEEFYLPDPEQLKALLLRHGHDAVDLVSRWRFEGENDGAEQHEAARELWNDYHSTRGVRL